MLSAQKARLVADQIRGKGIEDAMDILNFSPNKGAFLLKKVLESAIANAEHNHGIDVDELKLVSVYIDEGRVWKRLKPRAKGRGDTILKRSCHINVVCGTKENR